MPILRSGIDWKGNESEWLDSTNKSMAYITGKNGICFKNPKICTLKITA